MQNQPRPLQSVRGFTLIEIMTVVLIIGMLIAMGVAGLVYARQTGSVTSVRGTVQATKNAITMYVSRPGGSGVIPLTETTATGAIPTTGLSAASAAVLSAAARLDTVLLAERALESPLTIKLGTQKNAPTGTVPLLWSRATSTFYTAGGGAPDEDYSALSRIECRLTTPTTAPSAALGGNFRIDGTTNLPEGSRVQYLVIPEVQGTDAAELANAMGNMSSALATAANDRGPAVYAAPAAGTGLTTVYIYLSHQ